MKIAILGNMNNNGFSIMRYFRDLGADADLLLFANDGVGNLSHFSPEHDTWHYEKWARHVKHTNLVNGYVSALGSPLANLAYIHALIKHRLGRNQYQPILTTKKMIATALQPYNAIVGSGISPAILSRAKRQIDIYYPYSIGIEFFGSPDHLQRLRNGNVVERHLICAAQRRQAKGIASARFCCNAEISFTQDNLNKLGARSVKLPIPMVYNREHTPSRIEYRLLSYMQEIEDCEFAVFSHSRLMWKKPHTLSHSDWDMENKHSDWTVRAFADFTRAKPYANARLFIVEYGPDVQETKDLCVDLKVAEKVRWLPKLGRKQILTLISKCEAAIGEFYTGRPVVWGGTGWEALSQGVPLLQGYLFRDGEFESNFGYPPPPLLPVLAQECISRHLQQLYDNPEQRRSIGLASKDWFNRNNGIGSAAQWLNLVNRAHSLT